MEFEVTNVVDGIQQICLQENGKQLHRKPMSALYALRTDILNTVNADQKVHITCFVLDRQYTIKVRGAGPEDDKLIIHVNARGQITHARRFAMEFSVTSAEEGIQKICDLERRNQLPGNAMSFLYSLRTNICHEVGSSEKFCIHIYVMERHYKIKVKGGGDNDNRLTINIDENGRIRTQIRRNNMIEIMSNRPDEGIQQILSGYVFSLDRQEQLEQLRTDILKKLYGEENVQITIYVDQMCFKVNVKEAKWKVVVNITDSNTEIFVESLDWIPTCWKLLYWIPENVFPVIIAIFNAVSNLPVHTFEFIKWLFTKDKKEDSKDSKDKKKKD